MPELTQKARNLALEMVQAADQLMSALERFEALLAEKESSGIDWTAAGIEQMLADEPALRHVDGAMLNNAHSNASTIYDAMKAGGTVAAFSDDVLQALRP